MFNLGYKEVVLNKVITSGEDANVFIQYKPDPIDPGVNPDIPIGKVIEGYYEFNMSIIYTESNGSGPIGEMATWSSPTLGSSPYNVKIRLRNLGTEATEVIHFHSIGTDIPAGYAKYNKVYRKEDEAIILTITQDTTTGTLSTTINPGHESWIIESIELVTIERTNTSVSDLERLTKTVTTEGSEGYLTGKFIEESRKIGTGPNSRPYAPQTGGNDTGVALDGVYDAFYFTVANDETLNHEFVDHKGVNQASASNDFSFVVYVLAAGTNNADFKSVFDTTVP